MLYIFNYVMQMLKEKELKCQVFGELGLQRAYMGVLGLSSQWNAMAKPLVGSGGGQRQSPLKLMIHCTVLLR